MRIDLQIQDDATPAIRRFLTRVLPDQRQVAVEATLRDALIDVIQFNPVDTARSRAAWVTSLEELAGNAPAGWTGPNPSGEPEGRAAGQLVRQSELDASSIAAGNSVPYVGFLEYGTSRVSPFGMVRRSLALAREKCLDRLRRIFR